MSSQQQIDSQTLESMQEAIQEANAHFNKKMEKILDFRLEQI